jgi:amidase
VTELHFRSASELAESLRRREVSSRELLELYLARIEKHNPALNAVVTLDVERARKRAAEADAALARGESWGPLHGIPMTIKDSFETAGVRTTAGAPIFANHVPATDADAVKRLRDAGAVIFGKTNLPVMASDLQSYNPVFGTTNNPWDTSRTPGGSSGGAAAALAAGLCALELGSDIGGSIRTPCHWNGVFGHKPTHGIIPIRGHIPGPPGMLSEMDLGVAGPMARSAEDLDLSLGILAGPTPERAVAWQFALPKPRQTDLRAYRVAAWIDDRDFPLDTQVGDKLRETVTALRAAGVRVDEQARPFENAREAFELYERLLWGAMVGGLPAEVFQMFLAHAEANPTDTSALGRTARAGVQRHRDWAYANEAGAQHRARFAAFFRDFDVLLMPVNPVPAIPHDHEGELVTRSILINGERAEYVDMLKWISPATLCYLPASVAPVGTTRGGLPVGIQIVGPYLEDRTTIDFARRIGELSGGFTAPPGY